jgi:PucR family transcriptional regulator, purine catabolism regulatory protein
VTVRDARSPKPYVLDDLLAEASLGLDPATCDGASLSRRVSGVHVAEIPDAARWMAPDWVMLTTGIGLRRRPDLQRKLIAELQEAHVSALGFGVDVVFKGVPPTLLAEAQERQFPVFCVPLDTPFREVIDVVNRALAGGEIRSCQRLASLQQYLIEALAHDDPQRIVLERLAGFLGTEAILFDVDGNPTTATGDAPMAALSRGLAERADAFIAEYVADDWTAAVVRVPRSSSAKVQWLAVASPRVGAIGRLAKVAVQSAAPLISAITRLEDLQRHQEEALRAGLLEEILSSSRGQEPKPLATQLAAVGIDAAAPAAVVAIERLSKDQQDDGWAQELAGLLGDELRWSAIPSMVSARPDSVVALVQEDVDSLRRRLHALIDDRLGLVAGIGRPVRDIASVPDSLRDAELAARASSDGESRVVSFAELDFGAMLLSEVALERTAPKAEEYLGPLRDHPELNETLTTYFATGFDVPSTARELYLHPNSVRYRLQRIEEMIGRRIMDPATITALHLSQLLEAAAARARPSD